MANRPLAYTLTERKATIGAMAGKTVLQARPTGRKRIDHRSFCDEVGHATTFTSAEVEAEKVGQTMKTIIDRKEGNYYIGRTEYCSPEVDPEVLIPATRQLRIGEFYQVRITDSEEFDLYGEIE